MNSIISALLHQLELGELSFTDVLAFIDHNYSFHPVAFRNGQAYNEPNQNNGSAKVLAFGKLHHLSVLDTLKLFAEHHRQVAATPAAEDHQNIRQFIRYGWSGVQFDHSPLVPKTTALGLPAMQGDEVSVQPADQPGAATVS